MNHPYLPFDPYVEFRKLYLDLQIYIMGDAFLNKLFINNLDLLIYPSNLYARTLGVSQ